MWFHSVELSCIVCRYWTTSDAVSAFVSLSLKTTERIIDTLIGTFTPFVTCTMNTYIFQKVICLIVLYLFQTLVLQALFKRLPAVRCNAVVSFPDTCTLMNSWIFSLIRFLICLR
jgi:hypothetical protein